MKFYSYPRKGRHFFDRLWLRFLLFICSFILKKSPFSKSVFAKWKKENDGCGQVFEVAVNFGSRLEYKRGESSQQHTNNNLSILPNEERDLLWIIKLMLNRVYISIHYYHYYVKPTFFAFGYVETNYNMPHLTQHFYCKNIPIVFNIPNT